MWRLIYGLFCLVGAAASAFLAFLVSIGAGEWLNRMDCPSGELQGSGCYENDLGLSVLLFVIVYVPFFVLALCGYVFRMRDIVFQLLFAVLCLAPMVSAASGAVVVVVSLFE